MGEETSNTACGQTDEEPQIVGLIFCLVCGAVSADLAAFGALMNDNKAALGIGLHAQGHHFAAAFRGAISGIDVQMQ